MRINMFEETQITKTTNERRKLPPIPLFPHLQSTGGASRNYFLLFIVIKVVVFLFD